MFKIIWDKEKVKEEVLTGEKNISCLDFWVPVHMYLNGNDIAGGTYVNMYSYYTALFNIFSVIDPKNLSDKLVRSSPQNNKISEGGFTFFLYPHLSENKLVIEYTHSQNGNYGTVEVSVKDFAQEVLMSAKELLEEIVPLDPEYRDDAFYRALKMEMEIIGEWFDRQYRKG